MSATRVEQGKSASIDQTFYVDGAAKDADGAVTVTVTRADGTALVTGAATTKPAATTGVYRYALSPQAALDHLALTYTGTWSGAVLTEVARVQIVGDFYLPTVAIRALPNLSDATKFTEAELRDARTWFEEVFEDYTGVAWVRRFARHTLDGTGTATLLLPDMHPRTIRSVRTYTAAATYTAFTADELAGLVVEGSGLLRRWSGTFPRGHRNIVVEYEHGLDRPPADVVEAAKVAIRDHLLGTNVGNRQYAVATEAGVVRTSVPGEGRPFGIPDVDAVANRRSATGGVGSVVVG